MTASGEPKSPLDQLVDMFLYAPLGLFYERDDVLEKVVTRGKSQVQLARLMAKMASQQAGGTEAMMGEAVGFAADAVAKGIAEFGVALGLVPMPTPKRPDTVVDVEETQRKKRGPFTDVPGRDEPVEATIAESDEPDDVAAEPDDVAVEADDVAVEPGDVAAEPDDVAVEAGDVAAEPIDESLPSNEQAADADGDSLELPIADYDTLTARTIITGLSGLTSAEVEQVASYEREGRNRKTILAKAERLTQ